MPHLLGDDDQVEQSLPGQAAAAVVLGDEHRRPPELGALPPPSALIAGGIVGQASNLGERAAFGEEAPRCVPDQLLVGAQVQLQGTFSFGSSG